MLRAVNRAVLSSRTSEGEHERREAAADVAFYMMLRQLIHRFEESGYLPVRFKEIDDGFVKARQLPVFFIPPGIVCRTAVEDISAAIACLVLRYAFLVREAEHPDDKRPLPVVS